METQIVYRKVNNNFIKLSEQEQKIINIIRLRSNQKLSIIVRNSIPIRLEAEEEISIGDKSLMIKLLAIMRENEFQNINVLIKHGKPCLVKRTEIILLNNLVKVT